MRDIVTAISFDSAVMRWGVYVENKLNELDPVTQRPKYTLNQLLAMPDEDGNIPDGRTPEQIGRDNREFMRGLMTMPGVVGVTRIP